MKKQTNTDQQEPKDRKKEILEWLQIIIAAAVIAFCLNTFVVANSRVPSASMENTIMTGDRILGSRLSYYFGNTPERGDIVIFTHKAEPGKDKTRLVKRVIGLPGKTRSLSMAQTHRCRRPTCRRPWIQRTITLRCLRAVT